MRTDEFSSADTFVNAAGNGQVAWRRSFIGNGFPDVDVLNHSSRAR